MGEFQDKPTVQDDFYPKRQLTVDEILEEARMLRRKRQTDQPQAGTRPARTADEIFESAMRGTSSEPKQPKQEPKPEPPTAKPPAPARPLTQEQAKQPQQTKPQAKTRPASAERQEPLPRPAQRAQTAAPKDDPLSSITPWNERKVRHTPEHLLTPEEIVNNQIASEQAGQRQKKSSAIFDEIRKQKAQQQKAPKSDVIYQKADAIPVPKKHSFKDQAAQFLVEAEQEPDRAVEVTPGRPVRGREKVKLPSQEDPTKIISRFTEQVPVKTPDDLTGQVVLPGFETQQEDDQWELSLAKERQEKAKHFVLNGSEEEDDDQPDLVADDDVQIEEDEEQIDDYESVADASYVRFDLIARWRSICWKLAVTAVLGLILLVLSFAKPLGLDYFSQPQGVMVYLGIHAGVSLLAMLINASAVFGGMGSLFRLQCDLDTPVAIGMFVTFLHNLLMFFFPDAFLASGGHLFNLVAMVGLMLNSCGKLSMISRIRDNFQLVGNEEKKKAIQYIENQQDSLEVGRGFTLGEPEVCYEKSVTNLHGYLNHSFAQDPADEAAQRLSPYLFLVGAVGAVLGFFLAKDGGSAVSAITAFAAAVCACLPIASLLAGNRPLRDTCSRLREDGIILTGYDAVYDFSDANVLAVDAQDLFPDDGVQLYSIKTFGSQSIDRALLDAAGVAIMTGGPLASIFHRVIEGHTKILPEVDTLVYEDGMGVSGWVSGHRVLIGNRMLMENHGISMPAAEFEKKYTRDGKYAVFLSTMGVLSAMFLISYQPSAQMKDALQRAVNSGLSLSVYSCDPNITQEMLSETFDLPRNAIKVMNAAARHVYKQESAEEENADATLAHTGSAASFARAVTACLSLRRQIGWAKVLQFVFLILAFALMVLVMALGGMQALHPLYLVGYQLLSTLLILAIPALGSFV